jgi:DNA-binding response OmpR family regulator
LRALVNRLIDADQYSLGKTIAALVRQSGFGRANGDSMNGPLTGRLVLIAEDEPLIALDMTLAFEDEGAWVTRARTLNEALIGIEDRALSVAILDHALSDGDSLKVYARLKERNIPFVTYSGYDDLGCVGGVHVKKPASMSVLVATVRDLLAHHSVSGAAASQRATPPSPRQ